MRVLSARSGFPYKHSGIPRLRPGCRARIVMSGTPQSFREGSGMREPKRARTVSIWELKSVLTPWAGRLFGSAGDHQMTVSQIESVLEAVRRSPEVQWDCDAALGSDGAGASEDGDGEVDASKRSSLSRQTTFAVLERLRVIVMGYGKQLRSSGVRPEHLVPPVRHAMRDAAIHSGLEPPLALDLVRVAVLWGIEGYYNTT
jgi:hypothetical protein